MIRKRYEFWIDNGEEKSEEELKEPLLTLVDDCGFMSLDAMAEWAADELDKGDGSMSLIMRAVASRAADKDTWHLFDLTMGGYKVYRTESIERKELLPDAEPS